VSLGWKGNEEQRRGKKKERKEKKEEWCVGLGRKGRKERIRWDTCYHMDGLEKMR
jgi:hypothetical protein